jgi:outer membrane protein assembly factor BamB
MELETPSGVLSITLTQPTLIATLSRLADQPASPPAALSNAAAQKPAAVWNDKTFQEIAALAVTKNAVLVTGLNRDAQEWRKTEAGICALDLNTGKPLWRHALPADPVAWGLAIDRKGMIIVTLVDGRVMCFGPVERAERAT